ncbi:MAG: hypothetical protein AB7U73_10545 [Pirellulales bacterium]
MVLETEPIPFWTWLGGAADEWWKVIFGLTLLGLGLALLVRSVRYGPLDAAATVYRGVREALVDLTHISPRRVLALAWLARREALHRWVLMAFVLFSLVLLFGAWFLDELTKDPSRLYLAFVLEMSRGLLLLLALVLSVASIPADMAQRTIFTVVTKPVRASELVLGRLVGFWMVGTAMLVMFGLVGYVVVMRGLTHTHEIRPERVRSLSEESGEAGQTGETETTRRHHHSFVVDGQGRGRTEPQQGHWHEVQVEGTGADAKYTVGPPQGWLLARVPIWGKLRFKDRAGDDAESGVSVGEEWAYRSYIEGGTLATAIWRFEGLSSADFPDGLPLELTIRVFRTYKGDIVSAVQGGLRLRNPETGVVSAERTFPAREFTTDSQLIPLKLFDPDGKPLELFRDLVTPAGALEIELQCVTPSQYFGMAQPDLYVRAADGSFTLNYIKCYAGIWLQMLMLTAVGVLFSTFLNLPVALMATIGTLLGGYQLPYIRELASGQMVGGGPVEQTVRLFTGMNQTTKFEEGTQRNVMNMADEALRWMFQRLTHVLPDFGALSDTSFVADGFNIPAARLLEHGLAAAAFLVPVFVASYLLFRTREVAR